MKNALGTVYATVYVENTMGDRDVTRLMAIQEGLACF